MKHWNETAQTSEPTFDGKHEQPFKRRKRDANPFPQERLPTLSQLNPSRDIHTMAESKNPGTIITELIRNLLE